MALADFAETYDVRRHGGAFPANLSKTKTSIWKGSNLPTSSFGAFVDAIADNVFSDVCRFLGCFENDDIAGHDLPNLVVSVRRTGLMKQLFLSDSGKRSLLTWSR